MSALVLLAAILAALLGCACLALSQDRHWKTVLGSSPARRIPLRIAGWLLVIASLGLCIARDGASFAALLWPLLLTVGALATAAILTWRPAALRPLGRLFAAHTPSVPDQAARRGG